MNQYVRQAYFVQNLANAITEFIPATIMPESEWTFNLKPIAYPPYEFTLTYLTTTPGQNQSSSESYGTSIIAPEQASPVNLPRLSQGEVALLRIFGIQRALTLHPSQNRQIKSVFSNYPLYLPTSAQLSQLSSLFQISLSKAGVPDKYPFVVFATAPNVVEALGKCAGHRLVASFSPYGACINLGVYSFADYRALKNLQRIEEYDSAHISVLPMLSRYYENTTRDLYDRNAGSVKLTVVRENESATPSVQSSGTYGMQSLIALMKSRRSGRRSYQGQFFMRDESRNYYLNCSFLDAPLQDAKTDVTQVPPISFYMSRYIRYFPSLRYGPISALTPLRDSVEDAWNIFNHLPSVAKYRGTAVESIVVHELCSEPISEADFANELNKLTVHMTKLYTAAQAPAGDAVDQLEQTHKSYLLNIVLSNQNLSLRFNEIPTENAIKAIQCTTHFGTAAVFSFTDEQLDMDEAMIWAFNAIYKKATSTTVLYYTQLVSSFSQMRDTKLDENQLDELKAFVLAPKAPLDEFDYSQVNEYQILNQCPPCCCLCRCGELFLSMSSSDALNFAKDIISELKFKSVHLRRFDAVNHSIIYQKLVQINYIRDNLTNHEFVPYVSYTADYVLRIYAEFNGAEYSFDRLMKQFYFYQLVYQVLSFAHEQGVREFSTLFVQDFAVFLQEKNKQLEHSNETIPFASHMTSAYFKSLKLTDVPLMYPFSNQFIIMQIFLFLHEIQDIAGSEKFLDSLKQLIQLNYKTLFQQNQQFFETYLNLTYFVRFCAFYGLYWNYARNLRYLRKIEPFEAHYEPLRGYGYQEAQSYVRGGYLSPDFSPSLVEINNVCLLYENMHFVSDFYQISLLQARLLLTAITPFEANERELFKKKLQFKFSCWELVLNSISPSEINNLPHRFYAQFYGGDVSKNMFHVSFKDMTCCAMVETVPFRAFGK